jgi:hypothetical protein
MVLGFQGCLDSVPNTERQVLELRAGVGIAHTRSRSEVARLTGLQRNRVTRLERRGLQRLRALHNAGTCTSTTYTDPATTPVGAAAGTTEPASATIGVLGARESHQSGDSKSSDNQSALEAAIERPIITGLGHSLDLGPLLLAFALGGLVYFVSRELKRSPT